MRGFPSSHWLKILGTHYRVDPEFFRRHLEISQSKVDYKLSYLYSSGPRMVRLRVTDIFVRPVTITEEELISKRQEAARALRKYQMQLGAGGNVGESIIRRISYHDGTYFTIEHDISIYLKRSDRRGWYALVWNDVGRDLSQCPSAPWTRQGSSADQIPDLAPVCQPIRMYRERGSLAMNKDFIASASINRTAENLYQSSCLLPQAYGSSLNAQFIPDHPMYALSEIFSFAATSEHQFLSLIASLIHNEVYSDSRPPEFAVTNLKYAKDLLDDHANSIQDNMRFLIKSDCVVTESRRDPSVDDRVKSVIEDYTTLLDKASKLSALCLQGMTIIANEARLKEARNSSAQSKRSETLTLLAFFYLPLTLAASLFGMNVVQLGQGSVSIGWALLALFGFLMFQMAIYYGAKRVNEVVGLVDERLREALR
ncbi:hypothetical protein F5Y08DRAFT_308910 [Xylaria arbuscula]|nr:hypothetical protein F5Y08DRAFT_308910 [Xylaria arbuscula]